MIGTMKALESQLVDVKEISGSSAGSILALFMALGMSIDEILEVALDLDVPKFVKLRIGSFFNKFGFVDMDPIRKKLVEICGSDPTFAELDIKKGYHWILFLCSTVYVTLTIVFATCKYERYSHTHTNGIYHFHTGMRITRKVHSS